MVWSAVPSTTLIAAALVAVPFVALGDGATNVRALDLRSVESDLQRDRHDEGDLGGTHDAPRRR